jgi:hypothetical protein
MSLRKITSLTALFCLAIMLVTGIVLYVTPHGRVANWADWRLMGLTKTSWGDIHINSGLLFLLAGMLHVYYNWKPIVSYLKNRARKLTVFTTEFNVALVIVLLTVIGSYVGFPPFSTILDFSEDIKVEAAVKYGDPPYGHAELTPLRQFVKKMDYNLEESLVRLKNAGVQVEDSGMQLLDIAQRNNISPQAVYLAMKPPEPKTTSTSPAKPLPLDHPSGLGRQTLAGLCKAYGLDVTVMVDGLKQRGVPAEPDMKFKEMAEKIDSSPDAIFELVKDIAAGS